MPRLKRPAFLFFTCQDHPFVDIGKLLGGVLEPSSLRRIYALSASVGTPVAVTGDELEALLAVPSDEWVESDANTPARLADCGLLLRDGDDPADVEHRRRDELLAETGWNAYAALFHFLTRRRGVDLRDHVPGTEPVAELPPLRRADLEQFIAEHGPPPPAFHPQDHGELTELPLVERDDGLFSVLARRRTTRSFDPGRALRLDDFSLALRWVFGVHGSAEAIDGVVTLKRTSPSGGGLHPVEAYPLVANVEGLAPGLYHYRARDHTLALMEELASADHAYELGTRFMCGQTYFGTAHALFVLTARFERNHWKYRAHDKAYPAILMDAAHLSQTLYLVAAELGLGAFVTAAVNAADVDERLGLDGYREGALAIAGLGVPAAKPSPFDPRFEPYDPTSARA